MIKVGLTGGIGSGKSTVCKYFKKLEIPVFDSDSCAKAHYKKQKVKDKLVALCGVQVIKHNEVNTSELSRMVFSDKSLLEKISDIVQPYVIQGFRLFCQQHKHAAYCIFESAIIYERNLAELFDKIIIVTASKDVRLARVMLRNHTSEENIIPIINSQLSDEELKNKKHDFLIKNDGQENLLSQVIDIHNSLLHG